jgi:hypothetical protein
MQQVFEGHLHRIPNFPEQYRIEKLFRGDFVTHGIGAYFSGQTFSIVT